MRAAGSHSRKETWAAQAPLPSATTSPSCPHPTAWFHCQSLRLGLAQGYFYCLTSILIIFVFKGKKQHTLTLPTLLPSLPCHFKIQFHCDIFRNYSCWGKKKSLSLVTYSHMQVWPQPATAATTPSEQHPCPTDMEDRVLSRPHLASFSVYLTLGLPIYCPQTFTSSTLVTFCSSSFYQFSLSSASTWSRCFSVLPTVSKYSSTLTGSKGPFKMRTPQLHFQP